MSDRIPVITVDGPSSSGKGTIARLFAQELAWHFLDSGALYRLTALAAERHAIPFDDIEGLETLAAHLDVQFVSDNEGNATRIYLEGEEVTDVIRSETCGNRASMVAAVGPVRAALLDRQRAFRQAPGLVADGRDMGTVVFPDAELKIFLTASLEERASRRYKQLKDREGGVTLSALYQELAERDSRDKARAVAPLKPADGAITIDTSGMGIDEVLAQVRRLWAQAMGEQNSERQGSA